METTAIIMCGVLAVYTLIFIHFIIKLNRISDEQLSNGKE